MSKELKKLAEMALEAKRQELRSRGSGYPESYLIQPKYSDKTANGLTSAIVDYIDLIGGYATRINSGGVYDQKLGIYRHGTAKRGFSDIHGLLNRQPLYVEVKIGNDRQSEYQKEFQKQVTAAGGHYFIAKDFESFVYWLKLTFKTKGHE